MHSDENDVLYSIVLNFSDLSKAIGKTLKNFPSKKVIIPSCFLKEISLYYNDFKKYNKACIVSIFGTNDQEHSKA